MHRLALKAGAVVVLVVLSSGLIAWPASAEESTQTANILGFNRESSSNRGRADYANEYVGHAHTTNPVVISYQEVCWSQYEVLKAYLETLGWTGRWLDGINTSANLGSWPNDSTATEINRCKGRFGIATFTKFYAGAGNVFQARYSESVQVPSDGTRRGFVCLRGAVFLRTWTACGTHLTNKNDWNALNQLNILFDHIYGWGSTGRIMLGDYNLNPGQVFTFTNAYSSYLEASPPNAGTTWSQQCGTGSLGGKIDFTFFRHLDGLSRSRNATFREVCSDHRMLEGRFNFP